MSQNLQNFAKFQKLQLENLVDFEKCCKTHILLQKSELIQPKTSNILPKFCRSAVVSPTDASGVLGHVLERSVPAPDDDPADDGEDVPDDGFAQFMEAPAPPPELLEPELKGSIGEGSNHSNFSHQSSVKILSKFRNFR